MLPTLLHLLDRHACERGDAPAFIADERTVGFAEFLGTVDRTVAWLLAQGIRPGDRVAVWLVNRLEWLALYFALARIGAALMTVNTRYRAHELGYILERSRARLLVMQMHFQGIDFAAVVGDVPHAAAVSLWRVAVVDATESTLPAIGGRIRAVAFVIAQPEAALDPQRLQQAVAAGLAAFKVPAHIWLVACFPVTESANGTKVQRARLREMALQHVGQGDAA